MKRTISLFAAALLAISAAGCTGGKPTAPTATDTVEPSYVTAFGAVRCAESLTLQLPAEARVSAVYVLEGAALPPGTPVLKIDMPALLREKERAGHELAALEIALADHHTRIRQAETDLAAAKSASARMNTEKLAGVLDRLANAPSRAKRDACEHELLACLRQIGSVGRYHDLLALTADRRNVRDNARPVLLALKEQLNDACRAKETQLSSLRQQLEESKALVLPLQEKTDIMEKITGGQAFCGIGRFDGAGVLTTLDRPLMPVTLPGYPGQAFAPGEAVAAFAALDTLEVLVNVEEQLVPGVGVGAEVQLSPLYDRGVVWLGTVTAVSGRTVEVNGETVVPVTVKSKDMALGPGYNVTVKIYPLKK